MAPALLMTIDMDGLAEAVLRRDGDEARLPDILAAAAENSASLFARHGVKCTYFWVAKYAEAARALAPALRRAGHEIASHSYSHRSMAELDAAEKREEIVRSRDALAEAIGAPILGFRAPGLGCDPVTLDLLAEHGFVYDASSAVSPAYFALRAAHRWRTGRRWPIFGTPAENFGRLPRHDRVIVLRNSAPLGLPFYGTPHLYVPGGMALFAAQLAAARGPLTYLLHAIDFVDIPAGVDVLVKRPGHAANMERIVAALARGRISRTMAEHCAPSEARRAA